MPRPSGRRLHAATSVSAVAVLVATGLVAGASTATPAPPAQDARRGSGQDCLAAVGSGPADSVRMRAFDAAARTYDVPRSVLLGLSYMESRWDDHGSAPSTSGGYGVMHLTDVDVPDQSTAKGDGSVITSDGPDSLHSLQVARDLTGLSRDQLLTSDVANICGGAALLASYQDEISGRGSPSRWYDAVRRYDANADSADSHVFARRVLDTIRTGATRTTADGQRVRLLAHPGLVVPAPRQQRAGNRHIDCPRRLACEWIPAPYKWYDRSDAGAYGNHDLADRPNDLSIDYIVIHNTEGDWERALELVTDPTYLAWNYTLRSSDGHVAQHLDANDVGWHAGNWYVNMHSIGLEHEGLAAQGATWFTEAMYQSSASLVKYLARKYDVPLDRAHIIGHDQVPGITPDYVAGMHWDPGPYWNWGHYMSLLDAPIRAQSVDTRRELGTSVVAPGFRGNRQSVTGCAKVGQPCRPQGTNFVYMHTRPSADSPLVSDVGLMPDGSPSTTEVADIGARLNAGQQVVVTGRVRAWVSLWYLGDNAWVRSPLRDPVLFRTRENTVSARPGVGAVPVYGRAYPERSAYPRAIPYEVVEPLQYSINAGESYVLADRSVPTDFYYAKTFDNSLPRDHTVVRGTDRYYQIWFGHRIAFVRADDVRIT